MSELVVEPAATTPVFIDPTGRRTRALRALAWSLCALFVLVVGAVAFALFAQVPLPGLGGLVPHQPDAASPRTAPPPAVSRTHGPEASRTPTGGTPDVPVPSAVETRRQDRAVDRAASATAGGHHAATSNTAAAATQGSTPAPKANAGTPVPPGNSNPRATTKTRNPQAPAKEPSTRSAREPNAHAATGHGADKSTEPAASPPGRTK